MAKDRGLDGDLDDTGGIDWESPRWQAPGADPQGRTEWERRYRNSSARGFSGAIDTPATDPRESVTEDAGSIDNEELGAPPDERPAE
jgi:hypothetical protein